MKIICQQNFKLEFEHSTGIYHVRLAAYRQGYLSAHMFYPESEKEYILVVYDAGWYKFELKEFTYKASISYIAEKLQSDAAMNLLIADS